MSDNSHKPENNTNKRVSRYVRGINVFIARSNQQNPCHSDWIIPKYNDANDVDATDVHNDDTKW